MFRVCLLLSGLLFVGLGAGVYFGAFMFPINWDTRWHAGKSRSEWLEILDEASGSDRDNAIEALATFGPAVIDELIHKIHDGGPAVRDAAMSVLSRIGEPSLEPLRTAHHDPRFPGHRSRFLAAIIRIGPPAAPSVAKWLDSQSLADQRLALQALCELSPGPELVLPRLTRFTHRENEGPDAIRLLARLGQAGVPALLGFAKSECCELRKIAVIQIGEMGFLATCALDSLSDLAEFSDEPLLAIINDSMGKIRSAKP